MIKPRMQGKPFAQLFFPLLVYIFPHDAIHLSSSYNQWGKSFSFSFSLSSPVRIIPFFFLDLQFDCTTLKCWWYRADHPTYCIRAELLQRGSPLSSWKWNGTHFSFISLLLLTAAVTTLPFKKLLQNSS
jgi:hypothetical protein